MGAHPKPHATGETKPGGISERVSVAELEKRGVNVKNLFEKLIDAAGAEFTTYYTCCSTVHDAPSTGRRGQERIAHRGRRGNDVGF